MSKIEQDLTELVAANIIDQQTANIIGAYYAQKKEQAPNKMLIAFAVIGATLIGAGIILIVAANWDNLSRIAKTVLAFLPMLIGQALCGYTLLKKTDNLIWRESTAAFLFFAVAACIAMVSQIYNIEGNQWHFLMTWLALSAPLFYIMRSGVVAVFYLLGLLFLMANYQNDPALWGFWLASLPYYFWKHQHNPNSHFKLVMDWLIPITLIGLLLHTASENMELTFLGATSLFNLYYLLGTFGKIQFHPRANALKIIGITGLVFILFGSSFFAFWNEAVFETRSLYNQAKTLDYVIYIGLTLGAALALFVKIKDNWQGIALLDILFVLMIPIYFIAKSLPFVAVIICNILLFYLGIYYLKKGFDNNRLAHVNFGLLVIAFLIISRFLDINVSFVVRGMIFVLVGIGFFVVNYVILKKQKS